MPTLTYPYRSKVHYNSGLQQLQARTYSFTDPDLLPIMDYNRNGRPSIGDITIEAIEPGIQLYPVQALNVADSGEWLGALVTVICITGCTKTTEFYLRWNRTIVDTITTRISVTDGGNAGTLTLTETDFDSGVFQAEVHVQDDLSPFSEPRIRTTVNGRQRMTVTAVHGSTVTARYTDLVSNNREERISAKAYIDIAPPDIAFASPMHYAEQQSDRVTFTGYFDDDASGLNLNSAELYIDTTDDPENTTPAIDFASFRLLENRHAPRTGVLLVTDDDLLTKEPLPTEFSAQFAHTSRSVLNIADDADHLVDYVASIEDLAGNIGFSDAEPLLFGSQEQIIRIDDRRPALEDIRADAGLSWDSEGQTLIGNNRRSIRISLNSTPNPSSLQPHDFDVKSTITGKTFAVNSVSLITPPALNYEQVPTAVALQRAENRLLERSIFLTTDEDLPSDAELSVKLVGQVTDVAGNQSRIAQSPVTLTDHIPPLLALNLEGGTLQQDNKVSPGYQFGTDNKITVIITPSEPTREVYTWFWSKDPNTKDYTPLTSVKATRRGSNWRAVFVATDLHDYTYPGEPQEIFVGATARDFNGNVGELNVVAASLAVSTPTYRRTPGKTAKFILDLEAPQLVSSEPITSVSATPAIGIHWNEPVTDITARLTSHNEITNVTNQLIAHSPTLYSWRPPSPMSTGLYRLELSATDGVGNVSNDLTQQISIIEQQPFKLALSQGWNAVSFPAKPLTSALHSLFANHPVTEILRYTPARSGHSGDGTWFMTHNIDGHWHGDITEVVEGIGYLIHSSRHTTVEVQLEVSAGLTSETGMPRTPPAVALQPGWNLVGLLSYNPEHLIQGKMGSTEIRRYLQYVPYTRIYTVTTSGAWQPIPDTQTLSLGDAIWVHCSESATLTPL